MWRSIHTLACSLDASSGRPTRLKRDNLLVTGLRIGTSAFTAAGRELLSEGAGGARLPELLRHEI